MTTLISFFRRKCFSNSWNFWRNNDMQFSVYFSEDKVSSKLCGFEKHLSHISCSREGQFYRLEILHSPVILLQPPRLGLPSTSVKLNIIAQFYPQKFYLILDPFIHFTSSWMLYRACCHTCYTVQLMHYSHFKAPSL